VLRVKQNKNKNKKTFFHFKTYFKGKGEFDGRVFSFNICNSMGCCVISGGVGHMI